MTNRLADNSLSDLRMRDGPLFSADFHGKAREATMYVPLNARKVCAFDLQPAFLAIDRKDHHDRGARSIERERERSLSR